MKTHKPSRTRQGLVLSGVAAGLATQANAAAIDTTSVIAQIGEAETAILAIGIATIALAAVGMAIRWARGAASGK